MSTDPIRIEAIKNHLVFEGTEYHETDGLGKICRLLVQRGVPLSVEAHVYRGETLCLVGYIHPRAERVLVEPSGPVMHFQKFKEPPAHWKKQ